MAPRLSYIRGTGKHGATMKLSDVVWTDDDGQVRKDWRMGNLQDLEGATLMEQVVAPGSQVFAIGKWSAEKRGLIPDSGGTFFLPRLIGLHRATAMMMLGEKVSA